MINYCVGTKPFFYSGRIMPWHWKVGIPFCHFSVISYADRIIWTELHRIDDKIVPQINSIFSLKFWFDYFFSIFFKSSECLISLTSLISASVILFSETNVIQPPQQGDATSWLSEHDSQSNSNIPRFQLHLHFLR